MGIRERILVVDDEADTRLLLQTLLEAEGYAVDLAGDGAEALELVKTARPDLVVLDVMMPKMDGLQVCDHLRFDPETRDVPVIFLTAKQDPTFKSTASILDAYAYIEKPFAPDAMLAEIRNCLNVFGSNNCDDDRQHPSP